MENQTPDAFNTPLEPTVTANNQVLTPEKITKPNNFLVFLLSILLFVAIAIAGFFAYQSQKLSKEISTLKDMQTPVVAATESSYYPELTAEQDATISSILNWKTYTNADFGFSFRYPNTWSEGGHDDLQNPNIVSLVHINTPLPATGVYIDGGPNNGSNNPSMILAVTLFKNITNIDNWVKEQKDSGTVYAKISETKMVAGNEVFVVTGLGTVGGCTKNYFIKTPSQGYLSLIIEPYNSDCSDKPANNTIDGIVDQILSTFKFTN